MENKKIEIDVPKATLDSWQGIVDILAEIIGIPAALIVRLNAPHIEVFVSSKSEGNPYHPGDKEMVWGSGLYCETVIKTNDKLLVPSALEDETWKDNPDVKLNMISYLGFPILLPDGNPFGTICVLDSKKNAYKEIFEKLIAKFRDLVQSELACLYMNQVLGDKNKHLTDYLMEIQALRGFVTICSKCKKIRDPNGDWHPVEYYLLRHPEADFSHGFCSDCAHQLYPDQSDDA